MNPLAHNLFLRIADPVERLAAMEAYEERAAIKEFCSLMPRERAEREALEELERRVRGTEEK